MKCHIKVFIFISVQVFVLLIVLEGIYKEAVLGGCPIWVFDLLLTSKVRRGKKNNTENGSFECQMGSIRFLSLSSVNWCLP